MKKHIPNTITCCNLVSGCIAIVSAINGSPELALLWIIIGAVFDFFDGMSARLLGVSSPIGKELDSLADVVTFGVAPSTIIFHQLSVMVYPEFLTSLHEYIPYCAFIMAAFSALRLAKFNLDERQTTSFIGLPTPANALFWGSLIVGGQQILTSSPYMVLALHGVSYSRIGARKQLSAYCRTASLRIEVQALGMEGQRGEVHFHRYLGSISYSTTGFSLCTDYHVVRYLIDTH